MAARGETISGKTLLRNAGVHYPRLREYKQLISDTVQQLGASVDPRSMFDRDNDSHVQVSPVLSSADPVTQSDSSAPL